MRVDMEVAVGWFTWVGATVAGKGEAGTVFWLGVQPENTPLKIARRTRIVEKWVLVLGFTFSLPYKRQCNSLSFTAVTTISAQLLIERNVRKLATNAICNGTYHGALCSSEIVKQ